MPLFVMVTTSFKSLDEIRTGDLISLPREVTFDAWRTAWSGACTGIQCEGVRPFFWNSVLIAIPAVLISTLIGALNGYVVAQWRFKGANFFFALMAADGPHVGPDGDGGHDSGADFCARDLRSWLHNAVLSQLLRVDPVRADEGGQG